MFKKALFAAAIGATVVLAVPASAQTGRVELQTSIQLIRATADGEVLAPATTVVPGDNLEFHVTYRNGTGATVTDFVVVNPVPASITLAPQSASQIEVSVDGGTVWGPLATLTVADADGARRPATADDVTHLRRTIATLAPEQTGSVTYRGIVQ
jgi:uncharacterized repeat protein (TIGR01451 family)